MVARVTTDAWPTRDTKTREPQNIEIRRRLGSRKRHANVTGHPSAEGDLPVDVHGHRPVPVDRPVTKPDDDIADVTACHGIV